MRRYLLRFMILNLLVLSGVSVAQEASQVGNKKPRSLEDYQPRTLKEIATLKPAVEDLRDMRDRLVVTKDILPSMVQVTYSGSTRLIPQMKKETIRQWARLYAGSMEHYTEPYQSEMLFLEDGFEYWLAVQKNSDLLKRKLRIGENLDLYLIRLGAAVVGEKYDWTLLVEDFREAETSSPAAEVRFVDMRFGKPPLVNMVFDVVLRNDSQAPRWFLLPSNLGSGRAPIGQKGGVDTLEVAAPRGKGRVIIGRFLGTGGFQAILLPARAAVRLRRFPISYWGDPPASLEIEIVIATRLTIGGETAESWFGESPMSSVTADIVEDAENPKTIRNSRRTPDNKEVKPLLEIERQLQLQVPLERQK